MASTPDTVLQSHTFTFDMDQSYLPPVIAQCASILARYPVRDDSERGGYRIK